MINFSEISSILESWDSLHASCIRLEPAFALQWEVLISELLLLRPGFYVSFIRVVFSFGKVAFVQLFGASVSAAVIITV